MTRRSHPRQATPTDVPGVFRQGWNYIVPHGPAGCQRWAKFLSLEEALAFKRACDAARKPCGRDLAATHDAPEPEELALDATVADLAATHDAPEPEELAAEEMSTREIGAVLGVSQSAVVRDLAEPNGSDVVDEAHKEADPDEAPEPNGSHVPAHPPSAQRSRRNGR